MGGVHSGSVRSVELPSKPTDKITVWMDLDKSTQNIIKQDSVATIETEGLLGNEYVAVSFGSAGGANVADGGAIGSEPPLEMAALFKKASLLLDGSQAAITNVTAATSNLSSITSKINQGQGTIGALVNDKKIYTQLDQTTAGLRDTVIKAQAGVGDFQENMEALKSNFLLRGYFKNRGYDDPADLLKNQIAALPPGEPLKAFTFDCKQLFDKMDNAKPKNQKSLRAAGQFLADNEFGIAVIEVSSGMAGDTEKDLTLTQARALVVREYLVQNFGFDDSEVKTLGVGKTNGADAGGWGTVKILVYPPETEIPCGAQSVTEQR